MSQNYNSIRFISIIGGFLDGAHLELSDGLNCIIGARGTGKTTILEFVRYALDAMPADLSARKRIESLVERNLAGGRIQIGIQTADGICYTVSRPCGDLPVVLTEQGEPTGINISSGTLFQVDVYSQNEVESIADKTCSQLALIDSFEQDALSKIDQEIKSVKAQLGATAGKITPIKQQIDAVKDELQVLPGLDEKLKLFSNDMNGDSDAINRAHNLKSLRDRESRQADGIKTLLNEWLQMLGPVSGKIDQQSKSSFEADILSGPNSELFREIEANLTMCGKDVLAFIAQAQDRVTLDIEKLVSVLEKLDLAHKEQDIKFREIIERYKETQSQSAERTRLERLRNDLLARKRETEQLCESLQAMNQERQNLLNRLSELRDKRFVVRKQIVERMNAHLSPSIQVSIEQFGNIDEYKSLLEEGLRNNRLRHNVIASRLVNIFSPDDLAQIIRQNDSRSMLEKAEITYEQAEKVLLALSNAEFLFALDIVELQDLPTIMLNDGGIYKETALLSTGQKCTTILPILLMDSKNPLLIDQPEDNLDNRFVFKTIVESIKRVKNNRQLIFVTHNANIPVLGEADKIFVLESNGSSANKAKEGSVDHCKDHIVTLLEGGEEAFKMRRMRYAY